MGHNLQFGRPDLIPFIFPWGNNNPEYRNNLAWKSEEKYVQIPVGRIGVRNKESLLYGFGCWIFQKDLPSLEVLPIFWEAKSQPCKEGKMVN